jgi:hypothetical protein
MLIIKHQNHLDKWVGVHFPYKADPKECHIRAMKRILRYLVHTPNFGLWYPKVSKFDLIRDLDADYTGCKVDRKRASGTC